MPYICSHIGYSERSKKRDLEKHEGTVHYDCEDKECGVITPISSLDGSIVGCYYDPIIEAKLMLKKLIERRFKPIVDSINEWYSNGFLAVEEKVDDNLMDLDVKQSGSKTTKYETRLIMVNDYACNVILKGKGKLFAPTYFWKCIWCICQS
ncbi:hypothetical protein ACTA71_000089 [Dictyostelium dimigraforme]